jgi:DNA-binding response OmpR family regulator
MTTGDRARGGDVSEAIRRVWEKTRHATRDRAAILERAATAQLKGQLTEELRAESRAEAHRLAGTLGTFGFASASTLAGEAETILEGSTQLSEAAEYRLSVIAVDLLRILDDAGATLPQDRTAIIARGDTQRDDPHRAVELAPAAPPTRRPRIVAVDDDDAVLSALVEGLAVHGIDVTAVRDSREAVEVVIATRPDMVITDLDMPGLSGLDLCRQLKAHEATQHVPILFHTSYDSRGTLSVLFEAGADDHLAKPASIDEIAVRVRNRMARSKQARGPVVHSAATRSGPSTERITDAPSALRTVVDVALVDDDAILTELLCHSIEMRGHTTLVIPSGLEAVELLGGRNPSHTARVIVLDVSLPGLDGIAVLRALVRDRVTPATPVIMLTARTVESEVLEALDLGAFDHVAKPFSIPVFLQRLRRAMDASAL